MINAGRPAYGPWPQSGLNWMELNGIGECYVGERTPYNTSGIQTIRHGAIGHRIIREFRHGAIRHGAIRHQDD